MKSKNILFITLLITICFLYSNALAYTVTFEPRVTISEEYTDNVDLEEDDPESDLITIIQPGFTIAATGQSRALDLSYDPSYSWYQDHADYNTLRHQATLNAYSGLSRTSRIDFTNTYIFTEEPITDIDTLTDTEDRTGREPYYQNTANLVLSNQFGPQNSIALAYQHLMLEYEDEDEEDSQEHTPSLMWEYGLSDRIINQGVLAFTRGEFEESDDFERYYWNMRFNWQATRSIVSFISYEYTSLFFDQDEDDNYYINYPSVGLTYQPGEDTSISVSAGKLWIEREVEDDEEGLLFTSDFTQIWNFRRGSLGITGTSGYEESFFTQDNLGLRIYYQAGAEINYEMFRDIFANVSGSYRNDTYLNTDTDQEDTTTVGSIGLSYNRIRYVSASLSYDYRLLDSTEDGEGYEENRFSLMITIRPDTPTVIVK